MMAKCEDNADEDDDDDECYSMVATTSGKSDGPHYQQYDGDDDGCSDWLRMIKVIRSPNYRWTCRAGCCYCTTNPMDPHHDRWQPYYCWYYCAAAAAAV